MEDLGSYRANVTSQGGEDGVIAEILRRLGIKEGMCVEFGAWDGKHLSNTWNLWANNGWSALLIEGNKRRHRRLVKLTESYPRVRTSLAMVGWEGENTLDAIVARSGIGEIIDVLSIDIDGNDFYVWQSTHIGAKIVVIEYNASIPEDIDLVQPYTGYFGASAAALIRLGREKGYSAVAITETNIVFMLQHFMPVAHLEERSLSQLSMREQLPIVISDYSGHHTLLKPAQWGYSGFSTIPKRRRFTGPILRKIGWPIRMAAQYDSLATRHLRSLYERRLSQR